MHGSRLVRCALVLALGSAGCSLSDFDYLSADFGSGGKGGNGASGGEQAGSGGESRAGSGGGMAGAGAQAGSASGGGAGGGSAGTGGSGPEPYFCQPKYAVFDPDGGEPPPVDLPSDGDYVIRKHNSPTDCLLTPGWPALADKQYYAITQACEAPGAPSPTEPTEIWHFERLCSDVYRLSTLHGTPDERQLGVVDQSEVGTPLYAVSEVSHDDPSLLFQLRFEELLPASTAGAPADQPLVRWRISPLIQPSSCVEQISQARYGEVDVTRVVLYPCTGNAINQSWNLLALP